MMKRTFLYIVFILLPVLCGAQAGSYRDLVNRIASSRVRFSYTYSLSGQFPLSGSGTAVLQGDLFSLKGDGLEIRCDGKKRWTVDTKAEEVYIENADMDLSANPALIVSMMDELFELSKESPLTLVPKARSDIRSAELGIAGGKLVSMVLTMKDGSKITVKIASMDFLPLSEDVSGFAFSSGDFPDTYVITDLSDQI